MLISFEWIPDRDIFRYDHNGMFDFEITDTDFVENIRANSIHEAVAKIYKQKSLPVAKNLFILLQIMSKQNFSMNAFIESKEYGQFYNPYIDEINKYFLLT